jgi:hypothetical protein
MDSRNELHVAASGNQTHRLQKPDANAPSVLLKVLVAVRRRAAIANL